MEAPIAGKEASVLALGPAALFLRDDVLESLTSHCLLVKNYVMKPHYCYYQF